MATQVTGAGGTTTSSFVGEGEFAFTDPQFWYAPAANGGSTSALPTHKNN